MKFITKIIILLILIVPTISSAKDNYFDEAKLLFENKKYDESKFLFHRNIVFNPKDAGSYFYLAKIYEIENNDFEIEKNLNTTLLLQPNNEDAMYMLIDIELKKSNFSKVKELSEDFSIICSSLCDKLRSINERLNDFQEKNES